MGAPTLLPLPSLPRKKKRLSPTYPLFSVVREYPEPDVNEDDFFFSSFFPSPSPSPTRKGSSAEAPSLFSLLKAVRSRRRRRFFFHWCPRLLTPPPHLSSMEKKMTSRPFPSSQADSRSPQIRSESGELFPPPPFPFWVRDARSLSRFPCTSVSE